MAGDNLKENMDRTMSALRDRLRQTRENLGKVRENLDKRGEHAAQQERPPAEKTPPEKITSKYTAAKCASQAAATPGAILCAEGLSSHLGRQSARLCSMVSGTEDEFLRIGARLHDFHLRAHKISEMSEYVAKLINDNEVEKSIAELSRILGLLRKWLSGLPPDERASSRGQRAEKVVEQTDSCLGSMVAKHNRTTALAKTFSSKSENVTMLIGEVVRSLQYHDITRQRIEHVKKEIDCLVERIDGVSGEPVTQELALETGRACRELAGVLMIARRELGNAARSIKENLDQVASNAFAISEEIRISTKGESDSEKSFLSGMGNWLSALADTLEGFSGDVNLDAMANGGIRAEFPEIIEILNRMVKSMHRMNGNIIYHLSLIDESGKCLFDDIGVEIGMFAVHEKLALALEDVAERLVSIAGRSGMTGPQPAPASGEESGKHCAARIRVADAQGEAVEIF